jgi:hypothetical protein
MAGKIFFKQTGNDKKSMQHEAKQLYEVRQKKLTNVLGADTCVRI